MEKFLEIATITLFLSVVVVNGQEGRPPPLTDSDVASVRDILERAEKGKLAPADLQNPDTQKKIISFYLDSTNRFLPKAKLVIAACLLKDNQYAEAVKLAQQYVQVHSNDWEGLDLLGSALLESGACGRAIPVLRRAIASAKSEHKEADLEAALSYSRLAFAALFAGRADVIEGIAPRLCEATRRYVLPPWLPARAAIAVSAYAIAEDDQPLFVKIMRSIGCDQIQADDDLWTYAQLGCQVFPKAELAAIRITLQEASDSEIPAAVQSQTRPLSPTQTSSIRGLLADYGDGKRTLDEITRPDICPQLMAYWHCETNPIPAKAKLPLSRCFALSGEYSLAIRLADDYVRAYSNDWRGWRIIARAAYEMKAYGRACFAAKKGVALGETEAYQPLARSALMTGRLELIPDLIPKLLQLKQQNDPGTPQIIFTLALYSIAKKDKNLFVEAFKGVDVGHLLGKSPLRVPLFIGQSRFRASEVEPLWQEYRRVINE